MPKKRRRAKDRIQEFVQSGFDGYRHSQAVKAIHKQRVEGIPDPCDPCRKDVCFYQLRTRGDCNSFILRGAEYSVPSGRRIPD